LNENKKKRKRKMLLGEEEVTVIKAFLERMLNLEGEDEKHFMETLGDFSDRFNLITFLAAKLMTLHGKRTSDPHSH
jgi:hypothetical protein